MAMAHRDRQLSVFGVEARAPSPIDLEGLLAGAGEVARMGGTARVSIVVADAWRAEALRDACAARGLVSTVEVLFPDRPEDAGVAELTAVPVEQDVEPPITIEDDLQPAEVGESAVPAPKKAVPAPQKGGQDESPETAPEPDDEGEDVAQSEPTPVFRFRTAYSTTLAPLAARWSQEGTNHLQLDGLRLRLWVIASGAMDGPRSFILRAGGPADLYEDAAEDAADPDEGDAVGAALAAAGLPAARVAGRAGGPGYRIVGRRRIARLAELIGEPPRQVPQGVWPGEPV
jgi:hypothetical protein